jgi:hypothetical protein
VVFDSFLAITYGICPTLSSWNVVYCGTSEISSENLLICLETSTGSLEKMGRFHRKPSLYGIIRRQVRTGIENPIRKLMSFY